MNAQLISTMTDITLPLLGSIAGKGLFILVLGTSTCLALRRSSAANKHWICLLTLLLAAFVPLLSLFSPTWKVLPNLFETKKPAVRQPTGYWIAPNYTGYSISPESAVQYRTPQRNPNPAPPATFHPSANPGDNPARNDPATSHFSLPSVLALIWISGTLCCLAFAGYSMVSLLSLARRSTSLPVTPLQPLIGHLKKELRIAGPIKVLLTNRGSMPMVWSLLQSHLYLPEDALEWSRKKLEVVITHELAHLKRKDTLSLLAGFSAAAVHWFNPFAWLVFRALRNQQETACDDLVLSGNVLPSDYAEQILEMSSTLTTPLASMPASGMARSSSLYGRISAIVDTGRKRNPLTRRTLVLTGITAAGLVIPVGIIGAAELLIKTGRGRILDRNGIVLAENAPDGTRRYPHGKLAAHHVGLSTKSESDITAKGRFGIEGLFDHQLREGNDVPTTLDLRMQTAVDAAFRNAEIQQGAALLMDARQGDILASISFPDFDLSSPDSKFIEEINRSVSKRPPLRFEQSSAYNYRDRNYSPASVGSLFQLIPAIAASQKGMAGNKHECASSYATGKDSKCWVGNLREATPGSPPVWNSVPWHGIQDLETGTKNSCGSYFSQLAVSVGIKDLNQTGDLVLKVDSGFDSYYNRASFSPAFFEKNDKLTVEDLITKCTMGDSNFSYASPIHMVNLIAAFGNGGLLVHPRYSTAVPPQIRENLMEDNISFKAVKRADLNAIRRGMELSMSARSSATFPARSEKIAIAGKASTVQRPLQSGEFRTYSWFIGYTPAEKAQYAIAVMIENPLSDSQNPAVIARQILEKVSGSLPDTPDPED